MLIHYFITGLKPLGIDEAIPITTQEFLERAKDVLCGHPLDDLYVLAQFFWVDEGIKKIIKLKANNEEIEPKDFIKLQEFFGSDRLLQLVSNKPQFFWLFFWAKIKACKSRFLQNITAPTVNLYVALIIFLDKKNLLPISETFDLEQSLKHLSSITGFYLDHLYITDRGHEQTIAEFEEALLTSPIQLEKTVTKKLFDILDEHSCHETFSTDQIFVYFIKLIMCERLASFDHSKGQKILDSLVASTIKGV
jgi:hypothetical protein